MPILDIEIVLPRGERARPGLAAALAKAASDVFPGTKGNTWVRLHELSAECYAENADGADVLPVFVRVLRAQLPPEAELRQEVLKLAKAIAVVCDLPVEHVHIIYEPPGMGRVAFGGVLLQP